MMIFLRLSLVAAALSLSSCVVTTAPEPPDFKLSHEALSRKYPSARRAGTVHLYAQKIETSRDQWGRETHQATGGALLVKESHPPIFAEAFNISVTPEFSEAFGKATVKRNDRLYIGQDEKAIIRVDGTEIIPLGRVVARGVAPEAGAAPAPAPENAAAAAPAPDTAADKITPPPPHPRPLQEKPKAASKPRSKTAAPPARSGSSTKRAPVAKIAPAPAKPAAPSAAQPKKDPAADKSQLLNLMREPTDR